MHVKKPKHLLCKLLQKYYLYLRKHAVEYTQTSIRILIFSVLPTIPEIDTHLLIHRETLTFSSRFISYLQTASPPVPSQLPDHSTKSKEDAQCIMGRNSLSIILPFRFLITLGHLIITIMVIYQRVRDLNILISLTLVPNSLIFRISLVI